MSQLGLVLGVQGNELPDKSIFTDLSTQATATIINDSLFLTGESFRRRRQAYCPGIYADKKGKDGSCLPFYPAVPKPPFISNPNFCLKLVWNAFAGYGYKSIIGT